MIIRLITEFSSRDIDTKLYCTKTSYIYNKLKKLNCKFCHIDADNISVENLHNYIESTDTIVLSSFMKEIFYIRKRNPKFIYWIVLSNLDQYTNISLHNVKFKSSLLKRSLISLINLIASRNGLYFMDGSTLKDAEGILPKIQSPSFIPVPIELKKSNLYSCKRQGCIPDEVSITYIGRGEAKWKIFPLIKVIDDLSKIDKKFHIHILTDYTVLFEQLTRNKSNNIEITYHTNVSLSELDKILIQFSDLHIGMGTSALEGSKLGIPTILIDASNSPFPENYVYRWIYETTYHTLGFWLDKYPNDLPHGTKLSEIIDKLIKDEKYKSQVSESCFKYTEKHDIVKIAEQLLFACQHTTNRLSQLSYANLAVLNIYLKHKIKKLLS